MSIGRSLGKLFWVSRPVSWLNTAYPFGAGYLIAGGHVSWTWVLGIICFLFPYNLLMYGVNDVFDYESDIQNPRKGGIEGMREQRAFHPTILLAAIGLNIPFLLWLGIVGGTASLIVLAVVVFLVVAYSAPVLRFKERPVIDSLTSSAHFVGPAVFGLVLAGWSPQFLPYLLAFFIWGVASHALGAIQDIVPDRQAKIASVATYFGAHKTIRAVYGLYLLACLILFATSSAAAIVGVAALGYVLNIGSYLGVDDAHSGQINAAWKRFIWLNMFVGFVITMLLAQSALYS